MWNLWNLIQSLWVLSQIHKLMIWYNIYVYVVIKITKKSSIKTSRNNFLIHTNLLTMISISLFSCCKYMHNWEKFNDISLHEKEDFYNSKQYNIVSWSTWKLSKYVSWNI